MRMTIDSEELAELLGITPRQAGKIIRQVNEELKASGYLVINSRPLKAPRAIVLERLNIKEEQ